MKYIHRTLENAILKAAEQFPALVLTGPRQTGKSTLLKHVFPQHNYITLDDIAIRTAAKQDPALFVSTLQLPVIIDEIQYAPELLSYIKIHIDKERINGQFLLTGSQMFNVMAGMSETLAGRVALFELLPFSFQELNAIPKEPLACYEQIIKGFYPTPNVQETDLSLFYGGYLSTYIERDVRQIRNVQDIDSFQRFLGLLAARAGSLLNVQSLASECGISNITAKNWLSILQASRIIYLLQPYFKNINKRLVKSPKIYFTDTGLLSRLLRYKDADTLAASAMAGAIFENMVVMEALKENMYHRTGNELYFYRDNNKVEADLVIDKGQTFDIYEIKSVLNVQSAFARNLQRVAIEPAIKAVLSFHSQPIALTSEIIAKPWWTICQE